ncbi:hypothetical protein AVEN_8159-1 [Araneus ventricosus]|uniref:Uncharacterized protein n=1 Tax=Araneus ventricosus TaxID=182803 RepID=A0A4Y2MVF7_ARAVE|nr:hypothetical protein AVEN_8159-1 [Araneus ventricosus]
MVSSDGFLSTMVSRDQPYSQRILEISLPHRFLPQSYRKSMGKGYQENPRFCWEETLVGECCGSEESETVPCRACSQRDGAFCHDQEAGDE